jgi:biotin carboxylase
MGATPRHTILCLASYFKGNRFLQRCHREGCHVILFITEPHLSEPWAREFCHEVHALPSFDHRQQVIHATAYLMRSRPIDRLAALDDYDVDLVAGLREHFRICGMGETTARYFRDKLAMRLKARVTGIAVPEFVGLFHDEEVRQFLDTVPAPWLMKPRSQASSIGIKTFHHADQVWQRLQELGDERSFHLLERKLPGGELYHVDALVHNRQVVFAEVNQYARPLLEVYQEGGVYATRTLPRHLPEVAEMKTITEHVLTQFGLRYGCSHTEYLRSSEDGRFYFIETSARVGGANTAEMIEGATGVNLWEEWAKLEIDGDDAAVPYQLPPLRQEYGGVIQSLARQERPDTSGFADPEIYYRPEHPYHIGLVLRSSSPERIETLLAQYRERIVRDFHASLPATDKAYG